MKKDEKLGYVKRFVSESGVETFIVNLDLDRVKGNKPKDKEMHQLMITELDKPGFNGEEWDIKRRGYQETDGKVFINLNLNGLNAYEKKSPKAATDPTKTNENSMNISNRAQFKLVKCSEAYMKEHPTAPAYFAEKAIMDKDGMVQKDPKTGYDLYERFENNMIYAQSAEKEIANYKGKDSTEERVFIGGISSKEMANKTTGEPFVSRTLSLDHEKAKEVFESKKILTVYIGAYKEPKTNEAGYKQTHYAYLSEKSGKDAQMKIMIGKETFDNLAVSAKKINFNVYKNTDTQREMYGAAEFSIKQQGQENFDKDIRVIDLSEAKKEMAKEEKVEKEAASEKTAAPKKSTGKGKKADAGMEM